MSFEINVNGRPTTMNYQKRNGIYQPWAMDYPGDKTQINGFLFVDRRNKRSPRGKLVRTNTNIDSSQQPTNRTMRSSSGVRNPS
jgi:hypothetical protein